MPVPLPLPPSTLPPDRDDSYANWLTNDYLSRHPKASPYSVDRGAQECVRVADYAISIGALDASIGGKHPCEASGHIYFPAAGPGGITRQTAEHDYAAVTLTNASWIRLNYVSRADRRARGLADDWYNQTSPCVHGTYNGQTHQCHEFPYYATAQSGHGALLATLPVTDNRASGNRYSAFARKAECPLVSGGPIAPGPGQPEPGTPFLLIPLPKVEQASFGVCPREPAP